MTATHFSLPTDPHTHALRWTREAFLCLAQSQILDGEQYELLEGEILRKMKNPPHILVFTLTFQWLSGVFGMLYCQAEGPIIPSNIDEEMSLPEPDIAVLTRPLNSERPTPSEVRLVVEIADSTLSRDLGQKATLYARAGIPEYWVVDIANRRLHIHLSPNSTTGEWKSIRIYEEAETLAPTSHPKSLITVRDLLPTLA
jgi:Uma2 family endonuclease